jgi:hypothetical protein
VFLVTISQNVLQLFAFIKIKYPPPLSGVVLMSLIAMVTEGLLPLIIQLKEMQLKMLKENAMIM